MFLPIKISTKLVAGFIIAVLPLLATSWFGFSSSEQALRENITESLINRLVPTSRSLSDALFNLRGDVLFLSETPPVQGIIRARDNGGIDPEDRSSEKQWKRRLEILFSQLAKERGAYMQLRYIDEDGNEVARIDSDGKKTSVIEEKNLQNKNNRYYFLETMRLKKGELFISDFDLNREGQDQRISIPYQPTIRYATPVFNRDGKRRGIIISNVFGSHILDILHRSFGEKENFFLIDSDGFYLIHNRDRAKEFGGPRDLNTGDGIHKEFPDIAAQILSSHQASVAQLKEILFASASVHYDTTDARRFWTIQFIPEVTIFEKLDSFRTSVQSVALLVLILVVATTYFISRLIAKPIIELAATAKKINEGDRMVRSHIKTKDEIGYLADNFNQMLDTIEQSQAQLRIAESRLKETNVGLEVRIQERTAELEKLKSGLEQTVSERTSELSEKITELEKFQALTVGRELKMVELKKEIEELKKKNS